MHLLWILNFVLRQVFLSPWEGAYKLPLCLAIPFFFFTMSWKYGSTGITRKIAYELLYPDSHGGLLNIWNIHSDTPHQNFS